MNKKKYLIKFLCLLGILIVLDYVIGFGLKSFYFKQSQGKSYNLTYTIEQQTADVLIMGSSRAMHHYNPDIISDSLRLSCFNAGYDGQSILYHKALVDVMIERYRPQIIILDINSSELEAKESSYDLLAVLNPYIKKHPILWETIMLRSPFERIKHFSKTYPYNSLFARIMMGNMNFKTKDVSANGFTAWPGIWNDSLIETTYKEAILDENKINAFDQFTVDCKNKGITVYVVLSPMFYKCMNNSTSISYIMTKCEEQSVSFISYQNNLDFEDNNLFHDPGHLNDIGADKFSSNLSYLVKQISN
jgi:hypothetical protein